MIEELLRNMEDGTQNKIVLEHLVKHEDGLSTLEAFQLYNITRLSGRIHELRHAYGVPITSTDERSVTVSDKGKKRTKVYARYRIERS